MTRGSPEVAAVCVAAVGGYLAGVESRPFEKPLDYADLFGLIVAGSLGFLGEVVTITRSEQSALFRRHKAE